MEKQALKKAIIKFTELVTKRTCLEIDRDGTMFIDDKHVRYNSGGSDFLFLIHEVGHFVAARKSKRNSFNMGVRPFDKGTLGIDGDDKLMELLEELKAAYFGELLFRPWFDEMRDKFPELNSEIRYMEYLCDYTARDDVKETILTTSDAVNAKCWDRQFESRMKELNIVPGDVKDIMMSFMNGKHKTKNGNKIRNIAQRGKRVRNGPPAVRQRHGGSGVLHSAAVKRQQNVQPGKRASANGRGSVGRRPRMAARKITRG